MKVCIAEKPSVAREIASVLGANTKHDGYYEGNGYVVTYTFGHLCTLFEPNDYKPHWKSWDLNNLPMLPEKFETKVVVNSGIQKQRRNHNHFDGMQSSTTSEVAHLSSPTLRI